MRYLLLKYIGFLICFLLITTNLYANDLKYEKFISVADTLSFEYDDFDSIFDEDTIYAYVYSFAHNEITPFGINCKLARQDSSNVFYGSFIVPDNSVFGIIKIGDSYNFDTRGRLFWDYLVVNEDSIPRFGASYRKALSFMGTYPESYSRLPDFEKALFFYNQENINHPNNLLSQIAELSLKYELGDISRKDFENNLLKSISSARINYDDENEIELIIKSFRILGKDKKADKLEAKYIVNYPDSRLAVKDEYEKLALINNFDDFIDNSLLFLRKYKHSEYQEQVILAIIQSYMQLGQYAELFVLFKDIDLPSNIYYQLAANLVDNTKLTASLTDSLRLSLADAFIKLAVDKNQVEEFPALGLTPLEKRNLRGTNRIEYLFLRAKIHRDDFNHDTLDVILSDILLADKKLFSADQLYRMALYAYDLKSHVMALKLSAMYLTFDINDAKINSINKISYNKLFPLGDYLNYFDSLNTEFRSQQLKSITEQEVHKTIDFPSIKTLDGINVSLKIFRGRVIILYAFSNFCDQCWDIFADIELLFQTYRENIDIIIIPVLLWEKDKQKLKDIIRFNEKNKLNVPIYYDNLNDVYKYLSITGVPTICIIGQNGELNFRIEGIDANTSIFDQVKAFSDYLLGN